MVAFAGRAGGPTPADREAVRAVIAAQLDAFARDDGEAAFAFAAPAIRAVFGSVEAFMRMVRDGYPAVYRPRAVRFGDLQPAGAEWHQDVHLVGPTGERVLAVYLMQRQPDGSWRVNGCVQVPDDSP